MRIRVPSETVPQWFPTGTALRGLSVKELDALVEAAREGARRRSSSSPSRILQARHTARWEPGLLTGRSEFLVEAKGAQAEEIVLEPWTPAIRVDKEDFTALRVNDIGRTAIQVRPGTRTPVNLDWQLRSHPNCRGRGFTLGLPATEISSLTLDLPIGWTPESPAGLREGPLAAPERDRRLWRFTGKGGLVALRLHQPDELDAGKSGASVWISGPTRIDLLSPGHGANWRAEWSVDADPHGPRRFIVELDPGLELVDITGPAVESYLTESAGPRSRVTIRLLPESAGPTPIVISASARVPSEGPWLIPAARPVDALWTGGTTSVRLNPERVLEDCRERAGRRTYPRLGGPADPNLLVFEARVPESVAELVFRLPWNDVSVGVRGQLVLGDAAPRLRCRVTWKVDRGRLHSVGIDLPPAWVPDQVEVEGVNDPVEWHPVTRSDGGVRIHVLSSLLDPSKKSLTINLSATGADSGGRGPLALPRVRPVGVRVTDELWVAWTDATLWLQPKIARGLVWIDPGSVTTGGALEAPGAAGFHEALAWSWLTDDAEARIDRERTQAPRAGTIHLGATLDPTYLHMTGRIEVELGEGAPGTLPLWMGPAPTATAWRFTEEATEDEVARRPLSSRRRSELGFPEAGEAWELTVRPTRQGKVVLLGRLDVPWEGAGALPLPALPESYQTRGIVTVAVDRSLRSAVQSTKLTALDPTITAGFLAAQGPKGESSAATRRRAYAFGYTGPGGALEIQTETLDAAHLPGVIREAVLTTHWSRGGSSRQHLTLSVAANEAQTFDFRLPEGATLAQSKRDGQPVTPLRTARGLSITLPQDTDARANCVIALDYVFAQTLAGSASRWKPRLPHIELPCLSFSWQVVAPEPWVVLSADPGLSRTDPAPDPDDAPLDAFGTWAGLSARFRSSRATTLRAAMLLDLEERAATIAAGETSLGEWLTRWDAGPWPVVIDRMTLASAGWGPRSRMIAPRIDSKRPGAALEALRTLGLVAVPLGGSVLITTHAEAPDRIGDWLGRTDERASEIALRQASSWGSDATDRFQSVARWRGEATPRAKFAGDPRAEEIVGAGQRVWRFTTTGWPAPGASVRFEDRHTRAAWAWAVGLAVFCLGIGARRAPARVRATGLLVVLSGAVGLFSLGGARVAFLASAGALGALAVLFHWLGRSFPRRARTRRRSRRPPSSLHRREGSSAVALGLALALTVAARGAWVSSSATTQTERILALLPYEGNPDPRRIPDRAILRLSDFEALKALADTPARIRDRHEARVTEVVHIVSSQGDREAVVVSAFALTGPAEGSAVWSVPLENARDVSATLNGKSVPVFVRPGGRHGEIELTGAGPHQLVLRRATAWTPGDGGELLALPLNPVASARVVVEEGAGRLPVVVLNARGQVEANATGAAGWLGPSDQLLIRRPSRGPAPASIPAGSIEGVLLWDAEASGDRVRARLTCRNPNGTGTLRIHVEPGLHVRHGPIPGRVEATWQGSAERPEWVADIEPPLPEGTTIALEFWRPAPRENSRDEVPVRSLPLIDPQGIRRFSGALAFRRPSDWSGRLPTPPGPDAMTEESFVKLWGTLPDDPLTLSGVTRFSGVPVATLRTGLVPERRSVQSEVQLRIGPGRVETDLRAVLTDESGATDHADCDLPGEFRLNSLVADGLTDWSRVGPNRVRLRFDGAPARERSIRVRGWVIVPSNPLATDTANQRIDLPLLRWIGIESKPAMVTISAPTQCLLEAGPPVTLISSEQLGIASSPGTRSRMTYCVEATARTAQLSWAVEPPKVGVRVESQLILQPDSAEWVAQLRYEVSGGSLDAFHLKLPASWSANARIEVIGTSHQFTSETRQESTFWTIRPEQPVWGAQRLVVRAALPLRSQEPVIFPDLVPLGRGAAETYLAIVNGTGHPLVTEGSPSLQPIDYASQFRDRLFRAEPGIATDAFRVRRDNWALKVRVPGDPKPASGHDLPARVSGADISCTIAPDGSILGAAQYDAEAVAGPFLKIEMPTGSQPLWVAVNNVPSRPFQTGDGPLLVPLDEEGLGRVLLVWKGPPDHLGKLTLPSLGPFRVPMLLTVRAPTGGIISAESTDLEPAGLDRLEFERGEWSSRRLSGTLGRIDRNSSRRRETLVSSLVTIGLLLRSAERSVLWDLTGVRSSSRDERIRHAQDRANVVRAPLVRQLHVAGFDRFLEAAEVHLGLAPDASDRPEIGLPETALPVRTREIGQPHGFLGTAHGPAPALSPVWSPRPLALSGAGEVKKVWLVLTAAGAVLLLAGGKSREQPTRGRVAAATLMTLAGTAAAGPWAVGMGLIVVLLGWSTRP